MTTGTCFLRFGATDGEMMFGPDNLGDAAINRFLLKHACNASCHRLGLSGESTRTQSVATHLKRTLPQDTARCLKCVVFEGVNV